MVKADVIVGGFFGDEGKGKVVGWLGHGYDAVLRVNASTNAGHCVSDGVHYHVTRQLPSVFFPKRTLLVVGPGALLNPVALEQEVRGRADREQLRGKLHIASSISLVIRPYIQKGQGFMSNFIGSTHQGTGPSAVARAALDRAWANLPSPPASVAREGVARLLKTTHSVASVRQYLDRITEALRLDLEALPTDERMVDLGPDDPLEYVKSAKGREWILLGERFNDQEDEIIRSRTTRAVLRVHYPELQIGSRKAGNN